MNTNTSIVDATLEKVNELLYDFKHEEAITVIHDFLTSRKKAKPEDFEALMMKEIDLSVEYLDKNHIKNDMSHYRNMMQHTNTKTIEKCCRRFRDAIENKVNGVITALGKLFPFQTFCKISKFSEC